MPAPRRRSSTISRALRSTAALLVASAAAAGAQAASFDCKAARTPNEKAICASPRLSALDERLVADYQRALRALSPAGAAQLKASQRSWLRFVTRVCTPRGVARHAQAPAECLAHEYAQRVDQLAQAGIRVGPWTFNRIDFFAASPLKTDDGAAVHAGFVTDHVAFAQIDAPANAITAAWNAAQRIDEPQPSAVGDDTSADADDHEVVSDNDVDFTLGCASERFVSLGKTGTDLQHGAAHANYDHEVRNALLAPSLRKMTADDIFVAHSDWKTKLPALFWQVYARQPDAVKDFEPVRTAILETAADPDAWLLTPAGLRISFEAHDGGCYACNPGPITVPWSTLKPMLASPDLTTCQGPPAKSP